MSTISSSSSELSEFSGAAGNIKSLKIQEILEKYPLPRHWKPPSTNGSPGRLRYTFFIFLCLCAYGQPSLDSVWCAIKLEEEGDASAWQEGQRRTKNQLTNVLVVAGLLLATSAVFMTTPPPDSHKLDYTRRGPYLCICGAFGILMGVTIVTSICINTKDKIPASRMQDVFYVDTLHTYCTLMIMAYPSVFLAIGALLLAFGIFAAAWAAQDPGFRFGSIILLIIPVSIGGMFAIASAPVSRGQTRQTNLQIQSQIR